MYVLNDPVLTFQLHGDTAGGNVQNSNGLCQGGKPGTVPLNLRLLLPVSDMREWEWE